MSTAKLTPADGYPLQWPDGWERTRHRRRSSYKMPPGSMIEHLSGELRRFSARGVVVSSNVPQTRERTMRLDYRIPDDPGVAVYFTKTDGNGRFVERVLACDKWDRAYDNAYAIGLAIEHMRGMDRCGATQLLERAFSAFGALPPSSAAPVSRPWWDVLGIPQSAIGVLSIAMVEARYRELAAKAHPDRGGSDAAMAELNAARDQAKAHYG